MSRAAQIAFTVGMMVLLVALAVLARSCVFDPSLTGTEPAPAGGVIVQHHYDTVERVVTRDRVVLREVPARRITRGGADVVAQVDTTRGGRDTLLLAQPFTARLDTITSRGDTLEMEIAFPPLRLASLTLSPAPDTLVATREFLTISTEHGRPWLRQVGEAVGWMAVGYGLRWATEPRSRSPDASQTTAALVTLNVQF